MERSEGRDLRLRKKKEKDERRIDGIRRKLEIKEEY